MGIREPETTRFDILRTYKRGSVFWMSHLELGWEVMYTFNRPHYDSFVKCCDEQLPKERFIATVNQHRYVEAAKINATILHTYGMTEGLIKFFESQFSDYRSTDEEQYVSLQKMKVVEDGVHYLHYVYMAIAMRLLWIVHSCS